MCDSSAASRMLWDDHGVLTQMGLDKDILHGRDLWKLKIKLTDA